MAQQQQQTINGPDGDAESQRLAAEIEAGGVGATSAKGIERLSPEMREHVELRRQFNVLVGAIAGSSWGKNMSPGLRRAIAEYCQRYDVDPVTEIDNLGGSIYVNAEWHMRKLGEARRAGVVKDFWLEHIHADERLERIIKAPDGTYPPAMVAKAREKWDRSLWLRIEHNVPENAAAACICYIDLGDRGHPVQGCKWGGNGESVPQMKSGGGSYPNPIVENNPELSVESQAIRRAFRQVLSHVSAAKLGIATPAKMEDELTTLTDRVHEAADAQAASLAERAKAEAADPANAPGAGTSASNAAMLPSGQEYSLERSQLDKMAADLRNGVVTERVVVGTEREADAVLIPVRRADGAESVRFAAVEANPYGDDDEAGDATGGEGNPFGDGPDPSREEMRTYLLKNREYKPESEKAPGAAEPIEPTSPVPAPAGASETLFGTVEPVEAVATVDPDAPHEPRKCRDCKRTYTRSNEHHPDCSQFADV